MPETHIRTFTYKCSCGFILNVFVDCGVPQEFVKCRVCHSELHRECRSA